jgi:hypothetical protein
MLEQVKILRLQAQDWNNSEQDWAILEQSKVLKSHIDLDDDDMDFEPAKKDEEMDLSK